MRIYLLLSGLAIWASLVKAGQFISTYNLIAPQHLIQPQTYSRSSFGLLQPQYFSTPHQTQREVLAHPTVVDTSISESGLPRELSKSSNFYSNPYIASALAQESLHFNKEMPIYDRPSEKIPRSEIVKLINNLYRVHHESR